MNRKLSKLIKKYIIVNNIQDTREDGTTFKPSKIIKKLYYKSKNRMSVINQMKKSICYREGQ